MKMTIDAEMCTGPWPLLHARTRSCWATTTRASSPSVVRRSTSPPGMEDRRPRGGDELSRRVRSRPMADSPTRPRRRVVTTSRSPRSAPGEDLDWPRLEAYLRDADPRAGRRLRRPPVPQRLGQPDLPRALRRPAARRAAPAVRPARPRRPRHAAGVPAVDALSQALRPGAARLPVLRRPRRHRLRLPRRRVPHAASSSGTTSPSRWPTTPTRPPHRVRRRRRPRRPPPARSGGDRPRRPRPARPASSSARSPAGASAGTSSTPGASRR